MSICENISEEYRTKKVIDLQRYLDDADFQILEQLQITVTNKICTEFEFDVLKLQLERYDRPNENDFTLYGNYTEEETYKKFDEIMENPKLTERELVLLNMYVMASRSEKVETYRQNPEEKGINRERIDNILQKFIRIKDDINFSRLVRIKIKESEKNV